MPRPANPSATSALALQPHTGATPARLAAGIVGAPSSRAALEPLTKDERSGAGWWVLAAARELAGDFAGSIKCYEAALKLLPDHMEIANSLGRLAFRLNDLKVAEQLFRHFLANFPNHPEGANNLGCVLRSQSRFDEATDVLKGALMANPENAQIWNTLGTVMAELGDTVNAEIFFNEALRLEPGLAKARYNRGNMRMILGQIDAALEDCETALAQTKVVDEQIMMQLARSTILINLGRVGEGWDAYEARRDPNFAEVTLFNVGRPGWTPGDDLAGKSLLLIGEQGLGDEILFANMLPDILERLGPDGRLTLAVEQRLTPLFERAFPNIEVGSHFTYKVDGYSQRAMPFLDGRMDQIDLWAPLASPLREFRRTLEDFPDTVGYLTPDPDRVAHWRGLLEQAPAGRKVGLLWKSAIVNSGRRRFFSAFEQARRDLGVEIWTPPGIDLKQDLDDVAALSCALDLVIGFSNATLNIAGACGAPTWLISNPGAWPRLGTGRYPWYPQVRVFLPPSFGEWDVAMGQVAEALGEFTA